MSTTSIESRLRVVITALVGVIGMAIGFHHTVKWAEENGQRGLVALGIAVVIECMAIVAGLELRRRYGLGPLLVLVTAFTLQMAAQVSGARPTVAGWLLAATPALGFLVIVKFLLRAAADRESAQPTARLHPESTPAPSAVEPPEPTANPAGDVLDAEIREITAVEEPPPTPPAPEPAPRPSPITSPWA